MKKILFLLLTVLLMSGCTVFFMDDDGGSKSYEEEEPNGSPSQANKISLGRSYDAEILFNNGYDADYFYFDYESYTEYTITVNWVSGSNLNLVVALTNSSDYILQYTNGNNIIQNANGYQGNEILTFNTLDYSGSFFIAVWDNSDDGYYDDGEYTITVTESSSGVSSGITKQSIEMVDISTANELGVIQQ